MNLYKILLEKKSLILSIFFIVIVQYFLYINNSQKISFRFFVWNNQEIKIGKLICISFISGFTISTILSKAIISELKKSSIEENVEVEENNEKNEFAKNREYSNEFNEMPPERDLREAQPTISVNYRVIKNNIDNESTDLNENSKNSKYQDDWENSDSEW